MTLRGLLMTAIGIIAGAGFAACSQTLELPPGPSDPTPMGGPTLSAPNSQHTARPPGFAGESLPVGASHPWKPNVKERDWQSIVLHHTATDRGSVESIDRTHRRRRDQNGQPWLGIGYHFVIGNGNGQGDGEIVPTFRWWQQMHGAHAGVKSHNQYGIGIALVGNFNERPPSARQLTAVKRLVRTLKFNYGITADNVVGHGDIKQTDCPGKYFPLEEVSRVPTETLLGRRDPELRPIRVASFQGSATP